MSDGMLLLLELIFCAVVVTGCEAWKWRDRKWRDKELRAILGRRQRP